MLNKIWNLAGRISIITATLALSSLSFASAATLTADTSHPDSSTFAKGEVVTLDFSASGLAPSTQTTLSLIYRDANDNIVAKASVPVNADASGTWNDHVTAPSSRLGFYRVFASLADGTTLPVFGSRHAGYLTYAVVPNPSLRKDYGEDGDMFGMQGGFSDKVKVIPYLGVRWVLGGYGFSSQEKNHAGEFKENREKALAAGQEYPAKSSAIEGLTYGGMPYKTYVLPSLNGTPEWASIPGTKGSSTAALNAAGETEWPLYAAEAAEAFSANYPDYPQDLFQVTWEPVYPWGFKGTDAQLVRIYQLAYPALHKADPKAVVLGPTDGGIGGGDLDWTKRLLAAGLGKYIDGVTIHPYFALPPERGGLMDDVRVLMATVDQSTGRKLPFYGTEQGYATGEDPAKELLQAQGLVRENLIMLGEGFRVNFAFYITDYAGEPGYGFYYNLNPKKPFGTAKTGPKPVAPAFAAMTYLIDGHRPVEPIEYLGPTSLGYAFQRGPDVVLALWDYGDAPHKVSIPVGAPSVTAYDWMGNPTVMKASVSGQITVTLGPEPIYIKGVSPKIWGHDAKRPLTVDQAHVDVFPGQTVSIKTQAMSASRKAAPGRLLLEPEGAIGSASQLRSVHLTANPTPFTFTLAIPPSLPAGHYMAKLTLDQGGTSVAATGVMLNVQSPLSIAPPYPSFDNGHPVVMAKMTNRSAKLLSGSAVLQIAALPGAAPKAAIDLKPGQTSIVTFDCSSLSPSYSKLYDATLHAVTGGGYRTSEDFNVSFYPAAYAAKPPAMDASLADWSSAPTATVEGRGDIVRSPQYYNGALKAAAKFSWDQKNLYLAFDVTDPVFMQTHTGFDTWRGDCLQVDFNLDPNRPVSNSGNLLADQGGIRASEIDLALTTDGPQAFRTSTFDPSKLPVRLLTTSEIQFTAHQTPTGISYRAAIPWSTLGLMTPPTGGQRIGFATTVNDANQKGQLDPTALGLFVNVETKNPALFGDLVLVPSR